MGRINDWKRTKHRNLDDAAVQQPIEKRGRAVIATRRHTELHTKLVHIYELDAERPFKIELRDDSVTLDEEGRYAHRKDGGAANKALMRRYP